MLHTYNRILLHLGICAAISMSYISYREWDARLVTGHLHCCTRAWNHLPTELKLSHAITSSRGHLKTYLFHVTYNCIMLIVVIYCSNVCNCTFTFCDVSPWPWSLRPKSKSLALIPWVLGLGLALWPKSLALTVVLGLESQVLVNLTGSAAKNFLQQKAYQ